MAPYPLTNFEIQKYYQNEIKFNGIYSGNNLRMIKDGKYRSLDTHWIALYMNVDHVKQLNSFGVENILKEIKKYSKYF